MKPEACELKTTCAADVQMKVKRPARLATNPQEAVAKERPEIAQLATPRFAALENLAAERSRSEKAPQQLEKIESAPGNGMVSEVSKPQDLVHGRAAGRALRLRAARMTKLKVTLLRYCLDVS